MLAKGLIGAVLPALVIVAWLLTLRRWTTLGRMLSLTGLLLFLMVAAPWFVAMQSRFPDFLDYFFVVQHFKRFAAGGFNNVQPFWFYPALLLVFFLPWLGWLWRSVRRGDAAWMRDPVSVLMAVWVLVVIGFFSLPQSKLIGYVLPAMAPLAALVADGFLRPCEPSPRDWLRWEAATAVAVAVSLGAVVALTFVPLDSMRELAGSLRSERGPGQPVFMIGKYYYDMPVYARLADTVRVVDNWDSPDIALHDNERKELADAAGFALGTAARVLIEPASFPLALCGSRANWVLGPESSAGRYPFLAAARVAHAASGATLWIVDGESPQVVKALGCPAAGQLAARTRPALPGPSRSGAYTG